MSRRVTSSAARCTRAATSSYLFSANAFPRPTALRSLGMVRPTAAFGESFRSLATVATNEEMRELITTTIEKNTSEFGELTVDAEMDLPKFQKLINAILPTMGVHESKALFMSMDTSNDGSIQYSEIFSDLTLSILRNRISHVVEHPLDGSYRCLPSPPFHADAKQLEALEVLKKVFDEVVANHHKPVPVAQSPPKPKQESAGGFSAFANMFGGVRKSKAKPVQQKPPAAWVPTPNAPKGAYIYGGCGCGKTVLLDLFFRSLPDGFTARRLHWHEFIRDAFRSMQGHPPGDNIFAAMADMLSKQFRVLLLDELLVTHISEAILVKNLFRHMWARGMTIITTSNYLPSELYAKGFNRDQFIDFIPELESQSPLINMKGEVDYRRVDSHLDQPLFFHPVNEDTKGEMTKLFDEIVVSDHATDLAVPIPHENRNIVVPSCGRDIRGARVARFTFNDLCAKNLGRADYAVLAERYHTFFVDEVPQFTPDLGAEFRRFVSFTDMLYGKKVALYMQSDVHTDNLFDVGMKSDEVDMDEMWAFRRCSSMLSEMQNPKYHHMVWLMRNHMLQEAALKL